MIMNGGKVVCQWVGPAPVNIVFITFCVQHHLQNRNLKPLQNWQQQPQVKVLQSNVISQALNSAVAAFEGAISGPCCFSFFNCTHPYLYAIWKRSTFKDFLGNGGTFWKSWIHCSLFRAIVAV